MAENKDEEERWKRKGKGILIEGPKHKKEKKGPPPPPQKEVPDSEEFIRLAVFKSEWRVREVEQKLMAQKMMEMEQADAPVAPTPVRPITIAPVRRGRPPTVRPRGRPPNPVRPANPEQPYPVPMQQPPDIYNTPRFLNQNPLKFLCKPFPCNNHPTFTTPRGF